MEHERPRQTRFETDRARSRASSTGGTALRGAALAVGLLVAAGATARDGADGEVLTLDEAVKIALAGNPGIRSAELAVRADDEAVSAARTRYLPALSTQAHAGQLLAPVELQFKKGSLGTVPGLGPLPGEDSTVKSGQNFTVGVSSSLLQPITQLYTARQGVRLAETGREADRAQLEAERTAIAADVRRLYYRLVATQGALAAARDQLASQRELARVAHEQVVRQAALRPDDIQAQSAVALAAAQVRGLEGGLATGAESMNRLLGRDVRTAFRVEAPEEDARAAPDLETARAQALRDRPELRQARLAVEKAEADRRMKVWENVPEVSVGVVHSSTFNVETLPRNVAIGGVFASWSLDWGRRSKEAAQRSYAIEQARAKLRDAEAAVLVEVGDRFRKLDEARDQVEATRLALDGLRARAPIVVNRLRVEAALVKDALDVHAALARARQDHQQALLSLWSAQVDFEQALGVAP
jgi:outer membrane protein TolC